MSRKSILLVEDDLAEASLVKYALQELNTDVELVHITIGAEALVYLADTTHIPDFILLDINLPGLNGYEVLKNIRSNAKLPRIKVAFFSTLNQLHITGKDIVYHDKFIVKPSSFSDYVEVMRLLCAEWLYPNS